jgi:peroxiredoxin
MSKHSLNRFLGLFLSWFASTTGVAWQGDVPRDKNSLSAEIVWHQGDSLSGRILEINSQAVHFQSPFMDGPIEIDRNVLETIRMSASAIERIRSESRDEIHFANGSRLLTNIESIQDQTITILDSRFGKVAIPVATCSAVKRLPTLEYVWGGNLTEWQRPPIEIVDQPRDTAGTSLWFVDSNGGLATATKDAKLWLPMNLDESFVIEVSLTSRGKPQFTIATGADPSKALRVATIDDSLTLGTIDDFEIAGRSERGILSLILSWDKSSKRWSVRSLDGQLATSIQEKTLCDKLGLFLENQGNDLKFESLRVLRGEPQDHPDFKAHSKVASLEGMLDVNSSMSWIQWRDGSRIYCESLSTQSGRIQFQTKGTLASWSCLPDSVDRIRLSNSPSVSKSVAHRWSAGGNRLNGELAWGATEHPLLWKSLGQSRSVPLRLDYPQELVVTDPNSGRNKPSFGAANRDIAYMVNGDVIPCDLISLNENGAKVATPWGSEVFVQGSHWKSIELNANGSKIKHSFTKESRDTMLTLPRQTERSLSPHVLLGRNGDLLRGCVVAVSQDAIELDSKQEPMVVDRKNVTAIGFLAMEEQTAPTDAELEHQITLMLRGGFRLIVRVRESNGTSLECESASLGRCLIPIESIDRVGIAKPELGNELSPYTGWFVRYAKAPRWSENQASMADPNAMVGQRLSDFELSSLDGSTFKLSDYAGRVVVLDFWATWCGPCIASIPEILNEMQQFPATEAVFLGVNSTETPDVVRAFVERKSLKGFNSLFDFDQSLSNKLGVTGIPHTVVIGPDGEVAHVHVGYTPGVADEIARQVRDLLPR